MRPPDFYVANRYDGHPDWDDRGPRSAWALAISLTTAGPADSRGRKPGWGGEAAAHPDCFGPLGPH